MGVFTKCISLGLGVCRNVGIWEINQYSLRKLHGCDKCRHSQFLFIFFSPKVKCNLNYSQPSSRIYLLFHAGSRPGGGELYCLSPLGLLLSTNQTRDKGIDSKKNKINSSALRLSHQCCVFLSVLWEKICVRLSDVKETESQKQRQMEGTGKVEK